MTVATRVPKGFYHYLSDSSIRDLMRHAERNLPHTGIDVSEALAELLALRWAKRRNITERFPLGSKL